jgi:hypothetical protein
MARATAAGAARSPKGAKPPTGRTARTQKGAAPATGRTASAKKSGPAGRLKMFTAKVIPIMIDPATPSVAVGETFSVTVSFSDSAQNTAVGLSRWQVTDSYGNPVNPGPPQALPFASEAIGTYARTFQVTFGSGTAGEAWAIEATATAGHATCIVNIVGTS